MGLNFVSVEAVMALTLTKFKKIGNYRRFTHGSDTGGRHSGRIYLRERFMGNLVTGVIWRGWGVGGA